MYTDRDRLRSGSTALRRYHLTSADPPFWCPHPLPHSHQHPMGEVRGALGPLAPSRNSITDAVYGPYGTPVMNDQHFLDSSMGPVSAKPPHPRLFDTFHLRRAALGSESKSFIESGCSNNLWRTSEGFTGCIPTGRPAQITPIVRICVRYVQHMYNTRITCMCLIHSIPS